MPAINHSAKLAQSVVTLLKAHANLTALIGAGSLARLYGGRAVQGSPLPRVIFHEITHTSEAQHDSATASDPGVDVSVLQFDCEARTLSGARAVADAIAEVFNGGAPGGSPADIQASFRDSGGFAQPMDHQAGDGVTEAHRISVDYRFLWKDA